MRSWRLMSISRNMEDATARTSKAESSDDWNRIDEIMRRTLDENLRKHPVLPKKATASAERSATLTDEQIEQQFEGSARQRAAMGQVVHWPHGRPKS